MALPRSTPPQDKGYYDHLITYSATDGVFDDTPANADGPDGNSGYVQVNAQGAVVLWGFSFESKLPDGKGIVMLLSTNHDGCQK